MRETSIQSQDIHLDDAFKQGASQHWIPIEITQLSKGAYKGHLQIVDTGEIKAVVETQNRTVHKQGMLAEGLCTVSFIREANPRHRFSTFRAAEDSLFFLPECVEFDIHVMNEGSTVYFLLNQQILLEKLRVLNLAAWDKPADELRMLHGTDCQTLEFLTARMLAASSCDQHTQSMLSNTFCDQIAALMGADAVFDACAQAERVNLRRARCVFRACARYVHDAFSQHQCPSIVDICLALKVSQRTLQYSFQKILGVTPIAYLRYLRLNEVRKALLCAEHNQSSVTEFATRWHFLHMGNFSRDYYEMFGELPSHTLGRGQKS